MDMIDKIYKYWSFILVGLAFTLSSTPAFAQSETIDWADLNAPSLGALPNPSVETGTDGTTATVSFTTQTDGGSFVPVYGDYVTYYQGVFGGINDPLLVNFDNSSYDDDDKVITEIALSNVVYGLTFSLMDIDEGSFRDAVEVFYDTGNGTWVNAAPNTSLWTMGSVVERNTSGSFDGWRGNGNAGTTDITGNLNFAFGGTGVERIRIVYSSTQSFFGDPSAQLLGISDMAYVGPAADLSLTKTALTPNPASGSTATFRLNLSNNANSALTATGVVVSDPLPAGFVYTSASGTGTYNPTTGNWTVASIAPGQTVSIDISGTVDATPGATITNIAEIVSSSAPDWDSTTNNGIASEDDYDTASFTVAGARTAGTPPTLVCPNGTNIFDWDTRSWTAGTTNNTYAMANFGDVNFSILNEGVWVNDASFGGLSPTLSQANTGGATVPGDSLHQYIDFGDQFEVATTTVALPNGIAGAQFRVLDIDFAANDFADKLIVTGSYNGSTVMPTLTNGVVNYVTGNIAIGDGGSTGTSANGNVTVTFSQAIDTIVISYGNHTTAPTDPDGQAIAIDDFTFCAPDTELSVTKTSVVFSDPTNLTTDPKAIPGSLIEYTISVSNPGISDTDADTVFVVDTVPTETKMCVLDIGGAGPVVFTDGATSSEVTYTYSGLANVTDDLSFSNDNGTTWNYTPTGDADGCDSAITNFRVNPKGSLAGSGSFVLRTRFLVE